MIKGVTQIGNPPKSQSLFSCLCVSRQQFWCRQNYNSWNASVLLEAVEGGGELGRKNRGTENSGIRRVGGGLLV